MLILDFQYHIDNMENNGWLVIVLPVRLITIQKMQKFYFIQLQVAVNRSKQEQSSKIVVS